MAETCGFGDIFGGFRKHHPLWRFRRVSIRRGHAGDASTLLEKRCPKRSRSAAISVSGSGEGAEWLMGGSSCTSGCRAF